MRVVVAPDSFKGSIDAAGAAIAIAAGWRSVRHDDELVLLPMADGGEGTLDAFAAAVPGAVAQPVALPPGTGPTTGRWLRLGDTAVVELAGLCGLLVRPPAPHDAGTAALGVAMRSALAAGVGRLLVGIGGSASTDGGAGALSALGARLLDAAGRPIRPGNSGLHDLVEVDRTGMVPPPAGGAVVLSDVTNPLLGPTGAAAVFGPQKGAPPTDLPRLEAGLARFAAVLGIDAARPGAGAAGGTGAGLLWWGATLQSGATAVADAIGLVEALAGADLVITGEGRFDSQSAAGKAPDAVRMLAAAHGVPVGLIAGSIEQGAIERAAAVEFAFSADLSVIAGSAEAAMADAGAALRLAAARSASAWRP